MASGEHGEKVSTLLGAQEQKRPIIKLSSADGQSHYVRAITESEVINQICRSLVHQPLYIADGHHRYKSALTYRQERLARSSSVSEDDAFNFVMMTLVAFSDPGLIVLPPHRLVRGISKSTLDKLMPKLRSFFEVEEFPLTVPDVWQRVHDSLTSIRPMMTNQVNLALFVITAERFFVLRLSDFTTARELMPHSHSELYYGLDVSIVDHIILEKLLGIDNSEERATIFYSYDKQDAVQRVLAQEYQLAILLNPIRTEVIKGIADTGDRMPRKSTYFYPKVPSGLILNRLE